MRSKPQFTQAEASEIVRLIIIKLTSGPTKQKSVREQIRKLGFYASDYGFRNGYTVEQFLSVAKIENGTSLQKLPTILEPPNNPQKSIRKASDESYIIDLCDEILNSTALRQHYFAFLLGDSGRKLPVDAYYPDLDLVVEFREKQHTEEVSFFDRRQTVSGMGRGEQRKYYDQRRRDILPQHGIKLVELEYSNFAHSKGKKLLRNKIDDLEVIKNILKTVM